MNKAKHCKNCVYWEATRRIGLCRCGDSCFETAHYIASSNHYTDDTYGGSCAGFEVKTKKISKKEQKND